MPYLGQTIRPLVKLPKDPAGCWKWLGSVNRDGVATKQIAGRNVPARRWIWEQLFGPIEDGMVIAQLCGDGGCVNPFHLQKATLSTAQRLGANAILTAGDASAICAAKANCVRDAEAAGKKPDLAKLARHLAQEYEVSPNTIRDCWRGRSWKSKTRAPRARTPSINVMQEQAA